VIKIGQRA